MDKEGWETFMKRIQAYIVRIYNYLVAKKWAKWNNKLSRRLLTAFMHNICWECEATFGKLNPERHFYVIRCPQEDMGLFAVINYVVYHLKIAEKLDMEPGVDWCHYPNKYFTDDSVCGKVNAWDSMFEQPSLLDSKINLDEVYKSKNVRMSSGSWDVGSAFSELVDENVLLESHRIYYKYIRLNDYMKKRVEDERERIGFSRRCVLALKLRGTDFGSEKSANHARVPNVESAIKIVKGKIKEWNIEPEVIYLSTEDSYILECIKETFGEKVMYTDSITYSSEDVGQQWLGDYYQQHPEIDKIGEMQNYLLATYMLAQAEYAIMPKAGGTIGAMRIRGKYLQCFIV